MNRERFHNCAHKVAQMHAELENKPARRVSAIRHARIASSQALSRPEFSDADAELLVGDCVAATEVGKLRGERSVASVRTAGHHPRV